MNEFLSCVRKGRAIDTYYEEFLKLAWHAPLMSQEQKLSRFILGLEGNVANEVEALRPTSLADALIRAKSKLNSLNKASVMGDRKKDFHPKPFIPYCPAKTLHTEANQSRPNPIKANAAIIN